VDSWFEKVKVRYLDENEIKRIDPDGLTFFNVNTPEDLLVAEKMIKEQPAQPE
jgi:molybdopterin-guanine dinucleotide biosynthesis protein A